LENSELSGPDLAAGISEKDLRDGTSLLGHANGEPVLVVRRGDDVFAVAASCSHYGGPLAEGLVVGHTVRCPWHHACFDLRTGVARRAPALNDIASYIVDVREGRIVVGAKRESNRPGVAHGSKAELHPDSVEQLEAQLHAIIAGRA